MAKLNQQMPPDTDFECVWCREAEEISAEIGKTEPQPEVYTFPPEQFGGWDKNSKKPICEYCADAAQEEMQWDNKVN